MTETRSTYLVVEIRLTLPTTEFGEKTRSSN